MCIYCGTTKYRRIYEQHNGPIPKDDNNRSYEIHHIDGNHSNNDPLNLKCVTIQEHYDIHYSQGDYGACWLMTRHMNISPEEKSDLARLSNIKRVQEGTHNWLDGRATSERNKKRVENGTNPFLDREIARKMNLERVKNRTHPWLGGEISKKVNKQRMDDGTHNFIQPWQCEHCNKEGLNLGMYYRWHHDNCKSNMKG